jgi:GT2 family glycosyltransferase/ADP-heptose:LPS heptosyltransferase
MKKVSILILNHKQDKMTLECLESLKEVDYDALEILIINNESDKDLEVDWNDKKRPLKVINFKKNLGCAGGRNAGIEYFLQNSMSDYLFFLDNDTVVDPSIIKELVANAEKDKDIGIVGMKVYYFDEPTKFWFAGGGRINWLKGNFYDTGQKEIDKGQFNSVRPLDSMPGGFTFIKRRVLEKIGRLDERFFIYFEDPDWCTRVKRAGFKISFATKAKVWHRVSSSLGMESPSFYYYRNRNRLLFIYNNVSTLKFSIFLVYFLYDFVTRNILYLYLSKKHRQLRAAVLGVIDFFREEFGEKRLREDFLQKPLYRSLSSKLRKELLVFFITLARNTSFIFKSILNFKLKILVLLDWNLGDEIMAIPVYNAIKKKYPNSIINVKVKFGELLYFNPYVDMINKELRWYDKIMDIKGEEKTENRLKYLSKRLKLEIKDKIPRVYIQSEEIKKFNVFNLGENKKMRIAISTGTTWRSRQWGIEKFRRVAEYFIQGHKIQIIELGRECESISLGINLINQTSIRETAIILKQCNLFIGNDSGIMHLAMAVDIPTVALFGPLDPECLFLQTNNNFIPLKANIACQGCWSRGKMQYPDYCPKIIPVCMDYIDINDVIKASETLLGDGSML